MLTAGAIVQLWHLNSQSSDEHEQPNVTFTLGGEATDGTDSMDYVDEPDKPQGINNYFFENFVKS